MTSTVSCHVAQDQRNETVRLALEDAESPCLCGAHPDEDHRPQCRLASGGDMSVLDDPGYRPW